MRIHYLLISVDKYLEVKFYFLNKNYKPELVLDNQKS
ncbi:hypothetical protein DFQ05_1634 [Winogradskyella wandonensis]|uniref:Uncharacterized protein n=1 Tax=Winogradskyella wandonensis TaxID=1442586 RepID=A0A4R1KS46_9FLAO|nr:hypothetical protein DFQ05_1634 [Winogradskyella wandonensis]